MKALVEHILDPQGGGQRRVYHAGEMLFNAGDPADGLYYVRSGEVRIYKMDEQGREVEIVRLEPEDFFGDAVLFVHREFPAFAEAVQDSEVFFLEKGRLLRSLEEVPGLARDFITLLARKCVTLNRRIEALGLQTVRQRLIQFLLTRCQGRDACIVELDMKKTELARLLGTISETLSRNLKQLQDEGLILVSGRSIRITDCSRLRNEK
ncbi:MAG: Crp/Fnr family transcriptional regulator [Candidatus Aminicenantaceae bacterium]